MYCFLNYDLLLAIWQELDRIKLSNVKYIVNSRVYSVSGILKEHFGSRSWRSSKKELTRNRAILRICHRGRWVHSQGFVERDWYRTQGTYRDPYYVKEGRNELLGTFVSFVLAYKADRSMAIIYHIDKAHTNLQNI